MICIKWFKREKKAQNVKKAGVKKSKNKTQMKQKIVYFSKIMKKNTNINEHNVWFMKKQN